MRQRTVSSRKRSPARKDVDVVLEPAAILALAVASLADLPAADRDLLTRKLEERELG